jgi:hypothetical protein
MKYLNYRYLYPPRPRNAVSPDDLDMFDNNSMMCQAKLNGSNASIYTNGQKIIVMNRHGQRLTNVRVSDSEILSLYRGNGGWMILNCEYLNKSKSDETGQLFNHKFVIFDILCYDGDYLVGRTFEERINLLEFLYDQIESDKEYLLSISENVYRVKSYYNKFNLLFNKFTNSNQVVEGLVLKRRNARLEIGNTKLNNTKSQIKCRVATKNYKY